MSYLGGVGGGGRVPKAPNANNSQLQNGKSQNSIIKAATWGRKAAGPRGTVAMHVTFNRLPAHRMIKIEVVFNPSRGVPRTIGIPLAIDVVSLQLNHIWRVDVTRVPDYSNGYFTFRVQVQNESVTSDKLEIVDDNVAKYVKRISGDGFDR
jgi:hypothetical protein